MNRAQGLIAAACAVLANAPAAALDFAFSYSGSSTLSTGVSASGTLTTTDTATQVDGRSAYRITAISGTRNGSAIDQLFAPDTPVDNAGSTNDNSLFATGPHLTFDGLAFGVAADSYLFNLYYDTVDLGYREYISEAGAGGTAFFVGRSTLASFTLTALTPGSPAPEPATWATMIVGFGLVGGAVRRRHRATVTA